MLPQLRGGEGMGNGDVDGGVEQRREVGWRKVVRKVVMKALKRKIVVIVRMSNLRGD